MKTSILILGGVAVCAAGLSGCVTERHERVIPANIVAQACIDKSERGVTPQVMTYDSATGTETHMMNVDGYKTVTVQNRGLQTAAGMEARPDSSDATGICGANGAEHYVSERTYGPNPVVIGAAAGAVVGAAVTKNAKGAEEGAVIGGTVAQVFDDPNKTDNISIGAATGAVIGAVATKGGSGAAGGAIAGALVGTEATDGTFYGSDHDSSSRGSSKKGSKSGGSSDGY